MIASFDNSNKVVLQFNTETFVNQSVKLVSSVEILFLKFCYQKSEYIEGVYMEMVISCLTVLAPGIENCFYLNGIFTGNSHQFEKDVINAF